MRDGDICPYPRDCRWASVSRGADVTSGASCGHVPRGGSGEKGPVMQVSSQGVTVVALLADPDAPTEIAQRMARTLPDRLADKSGQGRRFDVQVVSEPFTAGTEDPSTLMRRIMDRASAENWDIVVALTDLPLHSQGRKLVVDLSHEHGLALLSLPTLGGFRLQTRALRAVEEAVLSLTGPRATGAEGLPQGQPLLGPFVSRFAPIHPGQVGEEDTAVER